MKRLLFALTCLAVVVSTAGIASGKLGRTAAATSSATGTGGAAVTAPAAVPTQDPVHADAYGFVTSAEIARRLTASSDDATGSGSAPAGGATATVTVTATVLPVRTIVVRDGHVAEVHSNTGDLDGRNALYQVRSDSLGGETVELDAALWAEARDAMSRADRATGRIA